MKYEVQSKNRRTKQMPQSNQSYQLDFLTKGFNKPCPTRVLNYTQIRLKYAKYATMGKPEKVDMCERICFLFFFKKLTYCVVVLLHHVMDIFDCIFVSLALFGLVFVLFCFLTYMCLQ